MSAGLFQALAMCLVLFSGALFAVVYKWVDEDGQVHYGDRPVAESSEEIPIKQSPDINPEPGERDRDVYRKRVLDSLQHERQRKAQEKARQRDELARQKENCQRARKRLQEMENARYLYDKGKDGEQIIYSKQQRAAATTRARAEVKKHCD